MTATRGIAKHEEKAIASICKELKQLNDGVMEGKPVTQPINFEELSDTAILQVWLVDNNIKWLK